MALAFIPATFAVYMRCSSEELLLKSARVWQKLKKNTPVSSANILCRRPPKATQPQPYFNANPLTSSLSALL